MTKKKATTATTPKKTAKVKTYLFSGFDDASEAITHEMDDYRTPQDCLDSLVCDNGDDGVDGYFIYELTVTRKWRVQQRQASLTEVEL